MNSLHIAFHMFRRMMLNRKGFVTTLLIPIAVICTIVILMKASMGGEPSIGVAYLTEEQDDLALHLVNEMEARGGFNLIAVEDLDEAKNAMIENRANAAVVFPNNFSKQLLSGMKPEVEFLELSLTQVSAITRLTLQNELNQLLQTIELTKSLSANEQEAQTLLDHMLVEQEAHTVSVKRSHLKEERVGPADNINVVFGFMIMFMMFLVGSTVSAIMDDRRDRTMSRMYTAPVTPFQIGIGNFLGSYAVATIQVMIVLFITHQVIRFDYGVGFWPLFLILEFFMLAAMGIASALAGMVKNTQNLANLNSLIVTPTCMLGGCYWPVDIMPDYMQKIANFVPQKWAIDAAEKLSAGEAMADILLNLGILSLFGIILLTFGSYILKPAEAAAQ